MFIQAFIWQSITDFMFFLWLTQINEITRELHEKGELGWGRQLQNMSRKIISTHMKLRNLLPPGSGRSENFLDVCSPRFVLIFLIHVISDYWTYSRSPAMPAYCCCLNGRCWDPVSFSLHLPSDVPLPGMLEETVDSWRIHTGYRELQALQTSTAGMTVI